MLGEVFFIPITGDLFMEHKFPDSFKTIEELAVFFSCSISTIKRLRDRHCLPCTKVNGHVRFSPDDMDEWEILIPRPYNPRKQYADKRIFQRKS